MGVAGGSKPSVKLGYRTEALEALRGADLNGKVAVVTGGSSGLGVETIRALAHAGADCVLCCRNPEAGQKVVEELQPTVKGRISVQQLDLADLSSIKKAGDELAASLARLDLLILNAGVMAVSPKTHTKDGFEMQIGTNHFGHFYLTQLLLPKMKAQGTPGRIVVVASSAHAFGRLVLHDLNFDRRFYLAWGGYNQSKLANVLFVSELARRLREEGSPIKVFALHPGIIKTNIGGHIGWRASLFYSLGGGLLKTPSQGASTTVFAATAEELEEHSGAYLQDCSLSKAAWQGRDADKAQQLWERTEQLLGAALQRAGIKA